MRRELVLYVIIDVQYMISPPAGPSCYHPLERKLVRKHDYRLLTQSSFQHHCLQIDCTPINAPSACCGKQGANGTFHVVASFCPVISVVFRLHVLIRRSNTALGARPCKPTGPLETCRAQRGFSWALLSWHCFHPQREDLTAVEPVYGLQLDFSKIAPFIYFFYHLIFKPGYKTFKSEAIVFS